MQNSFQRNNHSSHTVLIGFGGDTMLGRLVNYKIKSAGYLYPWGDVLPLLCNTDFTIVDLENTFTRSVLELPDSYNFEPACRRQEKREIFCS